MPPSPPLPPLSPPAPDSPLAGFFTVTFNGEESEELSVDKLAALLEEGEEEEAASIVKKSIAQTTLSGRAATVSSVRVEPSIVRNESAASVELNLKINFHADGENTPPPQNIGEL